MRRTALLSCTLLAVLLGLTGCRTPVYLGGEFRHRDKAEETKGELETFASRSRWIFFWGLLGTEQIDIPEVGGGFNLRDEVGGRFTRDERLVDLTVEEGTTIPGIITGFFTLGIVSQKEVVVKAHRVMVMDHRTSDRPDVTR